MLTQDTAEEKNVKSVTVFWAQVLGSCWIEQAYFVLFVGIYLFDSPSLDLEPLGALEVGGQGQRSRDRREQELSARSVGLCCNG